ncbi:hypothetical protein GGR52DRAFT_430342 [Hypoxylon sp. FL1284]|nr:hypothetical protein GGR52DRAFT_430342 [Hypoxylon sp. FL1284]
MNEGSYNNVIRTASPFSPQTPSTPNTYKTNVNRTKTRKWVEAKVQNYDGDDWGNEYEDEYDEPEQEPPPTSRVTSLRQNSHPQPRTFSQPSASVDSASARHAPGPSAMRSPSGPPSLHVETGASPRVRPAEPALSAPGLGSAPAHPPRKSSISHEASDSDAGAPLAGSRSESISSGRPSTNQRPASPAEVRSRTANSPHIIRPADIYRRVGEERDKERRSVESGRPSTDSVYGRNDGVSSPEPRDQRPLSTSPQLPDLARMSGFGDDFFSTSGGSVPLGRPSLSTVYDSEENEAAAGARLGLPDRPDDKGPGMAEEKHPPSTLEGPKLEPNPKIIMPPLDNDLHAENKGSLNTSQQSASSRPQLPGTWVSETVSTGSDLTPTGKVEGLGPVALGSSANPDASPMSNKHAEPADIEPTTTIKHLPSSNDSPEAVAIMNNDNANEPGDNSFNSLTGKHDNAVASKVIAAGPGHHPTPQSLPPIQTGASSSTASSNQQTVPEPSDMAPPRLDHERSPVRSPLAQSIGAAAGLGFSPTAPLNPRRSFAATEARPTPVIQERKSTMSTVDTASPEKESDKLREEIIKSLSASPSTTPGASVVLGSAKDTPEPAPGSLTRESTYLSGVYDDYLSPAEEKSLQETGQLLKQESMMVNSGSGAAEKVPATAPQKENAFPDVAPLSPHRSPEQQNARLPRRFSWEKPSESDIPSSVEDVTGTSELKGEDETPQVTELGVAPTSSSDGLQAQTEAPGTMSHQVSHVSSRAPGDLTALESPSPISMMGKSAEGPTAAPDTSRSSFAEEKEKVLILPSPNAQPHEQHPALASLPPSATPSPTTQQIPTAQQGAQGKIMAFRDILNIASIEQRIDRFDETRAQFYSMDSGLSNWIAYMQGQLEYGPTSTSGGQPSVATPSGAQPAAQQPYYQQYLNASNPGAQPGQPGRSSTGNMQQMFAGQPASSFGSGNQVGAKSKELLQAAGAFGNKGMKSGMKLFNKGKNKLRGTGDKVFF